MTTRIIHKRPWRNPFDTRQQARWLIMLMGDNPGDWERVNEVEEKLDETWWGRRMLPLTRFWDTYMEWPSKPQVIHIDDHSVWNMDNTLAHIIREMLVVLKKTRNGAGFIDPEDCPEELRPEEEPNQENGYVDPTHFDRYEWFLNELIWTFDNLTKDEFDIEGFHTGEHDFRFEEIEINGEMMYQMKKGPNNTFKSDDEAIKAWRERQNNGLRLFAKYYRTLWD